MKSREDRGGCVRISQSTDKAWGHRLRPEQRGGQGGGGWGVCLLPWKTLTMSDKIKAADTIVGSKNCLLEIPLRIRCGQTTPGAGNLFNSHLILNLCCHNPKQQYWLPFSNVTEWIFVDGRGLDCVDWRMFPHPLFLLANPSGACPNIANCVWEREETFLNNQRKRHA